MHIVLVAGESSGDQLGAGLVRVLRQAYPQARIDGIAGHQMQQAGCRSLYPIETLSVMGIVEVIRHLPAILKVRRGLKRYLLDKPPDLYIGIDAPDFNLPVEKSLKAAGSRVIHYVSPSVWAWREGRMRTIKQATDVVLAILPFEEAFYRRHHHRAVFVGHPLANRIPLEPDPAAARHKLALPAEAMLIGVLPGSRGQEIDRLLKPFLQALALLRASLGRDFEVVIPVSHPNLREKVESIIADFGSLHIRLTDRQAHTVLEASDYVLLASGTAALEAMLYKKPMVMAYKLAPLTYQVARLLVKRGFYSLPNLLAGEPLVRELVQKEASAQAICDGMVHLIVDKTSTSAVIKRFYELHRLLQCDADQKALEVVRELLEKPAQKTG